jgi:hypothetical protein
MINWKEFNWPEIFGTIYAVAPLMIQNQFRFLAADIQETATAKYSNGQLKYIGNEANGKDFIGSDGYNYESKMKKRLIQKRTPRTEPIILKNFRGECLGFPEQTFDYMMAFDYTLNTVLLAPWDECNRDYKISDSKIDIRLDTRKCEVIAENVIPVKKNPVDIMQKYNDFVASCG